MSYNKSFSCFATAAMLTLTVAAGAAQAGTAGKTITVESRFPDAVTVNPGYTSTKLVSGAGVDFLQPGYTCSITDTQVSFGGWRDEHTFMDYLFNGTVLQGAGGWSKYTIDPLSTIAGFTLDRIAVVDGQLRINFQGLSVDQDSRLTINVTAVPEPETYAMLVAGLALVGMARRRASGRQQGTA